MCLGSTPDSLPASLKMPRTSNHFAVLSSRTTAAAVRIHADSGHRLTLRLEPQFQSHHLRCSTCWCCWEVVVGMWKCQHVILLDRSFLPANAEIFLCMFWGCDEVAIRTWFSQSWLLGTPISSIKWSLPHQAPNKKQTASLFIISMDWASWTCFFFPERNHYRKYLIFIHIRSESIVHIMKHQYNPLWSIL